MLCISDAALYPIHVEQPKWCAVVDLAPEEVVATRRRLLNQDETWKALVLAFHFPSSGLGRIVERDEGLQWKPMETTG